MFALRKLDHEVTWDWLTDSEHREGPGHSEDALAAAANRVLICDTDLLATKIWSQWLFQKCDPWITDQADIRKYDLTLLTDVDLPRVADKVRFLPRDRSNFFERCETELQNQCRNFVVMRGDRQQRLRTAVGAISSLLEA
ncbi:MAG: AAA family ATPase [Planctomycetota bacterium]